MVLDALVWNILCFVSSVVLLWELTYSTMLTTPTTKTMTDRERYEEREALARRAVTVAAYLMPFSPAAVFFVATYSESTF